MIQRREEIISVYQGQPAGTGERVSKFAGGQPAGTGERVPILPARWIASWNRRESFLFYPPDE
jgi:hypothetical protein